MKNKRKIIIVGVLILFIILCLGVFFSNSVVSSQLNVNMVEMGDKVLSLKKGDVLTVNAWNPPVDITFNEEELDEEEIPKLFNGVSLGTNVKDVIRKFNIKSGYAVLNMEVPTEEHDGTTDIIEKDYKGYSSLPKDYLDCGIIFGYNKVNGEWQMVKADDIKDAKVVYYIDINGFVDELYDENEVIMFSVKYN